MKCLVPTCPRLADMLDNGLPRMLCRECGSEFEQPLGVPLVVICGDCIVRWVDGKPPRRKRR